MNAVLLALPLIVMSSAPRTPVLVELFTSEGCSSCPPADNALARLAQKQPVEGVELIALGFHVDYWDYIGWKDPYASPEYAQRQRRYVLDGDDNRLYTPQMIVDGARGFVGGEDEARAQAALAAKRPKVPLRLTPRVEEDTVVVRVQLEAAPGQGLEVLYGPPWNLVPIGTAMNKGLTLRMNQCNVRRYMPHLRSQKRAGILNFSPGVFEPEMEGIAQWFKEHPPGDARSRNPRSA